jgi:hypothetical protein
VIARGIANGCGSQERGSEISYPFNPRANESENNANASENEKYVPQPTLS